MFRRLGELLMKIPFINKLIKKSNNLSKSIPSSIHQTEGAFQASINAIKAGKNSVNSQTINHYYSTDSELVNKEIESILDRLQKGRFFSRFEVINEALILSNQIMTGNLVSGSLRVKYIALAWCARLLAYKNTNEAKKLLEYISNTKIILLESTFACAFIKDAEGNWKDALGMLSNINSAEAKSIIFSIQARNTSPGSKLAWFNSVGYKPSDLSPFGKNLYLVTCYEEKQWMLALDTLNSLTETDYQECPALYFISGLIYLTQTVPDEYRTVIWQQIPFALDKFPISELPKDRILLTKATYYFNKTIEVTKGLDLLDSMRTASDYCLWVTLRNPDTKDEGLQILRNSLNIPQDVLRRVNFAIRYNIPFDLEAISKLINQETMLTGGKSVDAAIARFALAFMQETDKKFIEYIGEHREQLYSNLNIEFVADAEIEVLARLGRQTEAQKRLEELKDKNIDSQTVTRITKLIERTTNSDPVSIIIEEYEKDPTLENLTSLINKLEEFEQWEKLAHYLKLYLNKIPSIGTTIKLVNTLLKVGKISQIYPVLKTYNDFIKDSQVLQNIWCQVLYHEGKLLDAKKALKEFRLKYNKSNDLNLEINIVISSGSWEEFSTIINREWECRDSKTSDDLLNLAKLACSIDSPRIKDLLKIAITKDKENPNTLWNAYIIATQCGFERDEDVRHWINNAIKLSVSDNSSIQKKTLEELVEQKPIWEKQQIELWQKIRHCEIPLMLVADASNRTLCDIILLPALGNLHKTNIKQKSIIYTYSVNRSNQYLNLENIRKIALDITALLTLSLMDCVDKVITSFDEIIIPHSTMGWLYDEYQRIKFHQPSRINRAKYIRSLIAENKLRSFETTTEINTDLAAEIGESLASFLAHAQYENSGVNSVQQIIISCYPVHRVGSFLKEIVDLTNYSNYFCSRYAVIDKLKEKGILTSSEVEYAYAFLGLQKDQRWPDEPTINDNAVLYLDDVTISFFDHLGILEKIHLSGLMGVISSCESDEISILIDHDTLITEAVEIITKLRMDLVNGIENGKVRLFSLPDLANNEKDIPNNIRNYPTMILFDLASVVDAVVIDDRFIQNNISLENTLTLTSLDLITYLESDEKVFEKKRLLRKAGFMHVPLEEKELNAYLSQVNYIVKDSQYILQETAELKTIKEGIQLLCIRSSLCLPNETNYLINFLQTVSNALQAQWMEEGATLENKQACSTWLLELLDTRAYTTCFDDINQGKLFLFSGLRVVLFLLLKPLKKTDQDYWVWLEKNVLDWCKNKYPNVYDEFLNIWEHEIINLIPKYMQYYEENTGQKISERIATFEVLKLHNPPSIIHILLNRESFTTKCNIETEGVIGLTDIQGNIVVNISEDELTQGVKTAFINSSQVTTLKDMDGNEWLFIDIDLINGSLKLCRNNKVLSLPNFWMLLPTSSKRLEIFDELVNKYNLTKVLKEQWQRKLLQDTISYKDIVEINYDLFETPLFVMDKIRKSMSDSSCKIDTFMPTSLYYSSMFIGDYVQGYSREDFINIELKKKIDHFINWNSEKGLILALHLSAHSSIVQLINIEGIEKQILINVFSYLSNSNDRFSQVGAIELGMSIVEKNPELESFIIAMIKQIINEDITLKDSPCHLLSCLMILTLGTISISKKFQNHPPFWTRLLGIAQASLITQSFDGIDFDVKQFCDWILSTNNFYQCFYMQTLCELRIEPRWFPEYITPNQLKSELTGRIINLKNQIPDCCLELNKIFNAINPDATCFYPGPLEGEVNNNFSISSEVSEIIYEALNTEPITIKSFYPLVNAAPLFNLDNEFIEMTIQALHKSKHYLKHDGNTENLFHALSGLARVAAVSKNKDLAEDIKMVVWRSKNLNANLLNIHDLLVIGLTTAAAYTDFNEWLKVVGDWINQIAFRDLSKDEIDYLSSQIECLCQIVPELWTTVGRAYTVLKVIKC